MTNETVVWLNTGLNVFMFIFRSKCIIRGHHYNIWDGEAEENLLPDIVQTI
jgi:hypothetical protein